MSSVTDSKMLRFANRVAVITGAGGGLGREYALLLASRGAAVIVNDLGGDTKGGGKSSAAADKVVQEIRDKGGRAVPNYDSVEDGEKIIETALKHFGRIDILVNNAGILRDRTIARTSDLDWDLVHRVHLRGSFLVSRAAWPHMKKQNFGRIIMTASAAGIYGNFGQTNYSAAKLGLAGMSNTLALEGRKYNIFCNTIAPVAISRMTEDIFPDEIKPLLKPVNVAPLVAYLCHEDSEETGDYLKSAVGSENVSMRFKVRWQRANGAVCLKSDQGITPESVRDNWEQITDFDESSNPSSVAESMTTILDSIRQAQSAPPPSGPPVTSDNPSDAVGHVLPTNNFEYTSRDVMLYNLGVGVSTQQSDYLKFLFELNQDFCVLPTFGVIPAFSALQSLLSGDVPGMNSINPARILHGEQFLEVVKPIPTSGTLRNEAVVTDVLDKKSGAVILMDINSYDENNDLILHNQFSTFAVGSGGFGGKRSSDKAVVTVKPPDRAPDASMSEKTSVDQAALYRLSGDYNPLHIDPSFAAMGGFGTPILHGLCSFGFSGRHVLKTFCDNDVSKFKAIKVRFSGVVLPGQTIQTDMWKEGNRIYFRSKVVETGKDCISGAYMDITEGSQLSQTSSSVGALKSDVVFTEIGKHLAADANLYKKVNGIIAYKITNGGSLAKTWTLDLKNPTGSVYEGNPKSAKADATVTIEDADFADIASGAKNAQSLFQSGKLKAAGNVMLLMKMGR
ncbi:putative peroxisomal multifunctional enzyme type 2 [Apostichopus japonicus]|uniref:Peroxisomal multifunctional enzyme type 2 n=1 Tax=Stichopus japonicus TaxID=307972 RepID=A0A2G8JLD0_STIJA|nr:putative peroxisomal multifunctional enzyme type 2 [Apostichopus japonicus]